MPDVNLSDYVTPAAPPARASSSGVSLSDYVDPFNPTAARQDLGNYFRQKYGRNLPVSSIGQDAVHNRLGWNHRDAFDLRLHPDSPEGHDVISYLTENNIPFTPFHGAIPGHATGPHIHVGLPSHRLGASPSASTSSSQPAAQASSETTQPQSDVSLSDYVTPATNGATGGTPAVRPQPAYETVHTRKTQTITVGANDTLESLSRRYGMNADDLVRMNGLGGAPSAGSQILVTVPTTIRRPVRHARSYTPIQEVDRQTRPQTPESVGRLSASASPQTHAQAIAADLQNLPVGVREIATGLIGSSGAGAQSLANVQRVGSVISGQEILGRYSPARLSADYLEQQFAQPNLEGAEIASRNQGLASQLLTSTARAVGDIPRIALSMGAMGSAPLGMSFDAAINSAHRGPVEVAKRSVEGLVLGHALSMGAGSSMAYRAATSAGMGYAAARASGATHREAMVSGITQGALSLHGGSRGIHKVGRCERCSLALSLHGGSRGRAEVPNESYTVPELQGIPDTWQMAVREGGRVRQPQAGTYEESLGDESFWNNARHILQNDSSNPNLDRYGMVAPDGSFRSAREILQHGNAEPSSPETIVRHSNPEIDGGRVVGHRPNGDLVVENASDPSITHTVRNPRGRGNREAVLVNSTPSVSDVGRAFERFAPERGASSPAQRQQSPEDVSLADYLENQSPGMPRPDIEHPAVRSTKLRTAVSLYKAGLVTGIRTHLRNVGSNTAMQAMEEVSRMPASLVDLAVSGATGVRTTLAPDLLAVARSSHEAATRGVREAAEIMRTGTPEDALAKFGEHQELNSGSRIIDGYVNGTFRLLSAEDRVFKVYAMRRSLEEQARTWATNEARNGVIERNQITARQAELVANPTPEMQAQAITDAEFSTFNNPNRSHSLIEGVKRGVSSVRGGRYVAAAIDVALPFVRTPANIVARTLEYSPLGVGRAAIRAGRAIADSAFTESQQREFARTIGRSVTGSSLLLLGYTLAKKGMMTGTVTGDDEDWSNLALNRASGRSPASIYNPATRTWHQIGGINPLGTLLVTGATIYEQTHRAQPASSSHAALTAGLNLVADQPFFKAGLGDSPFTNLQDAVGRKLGSVVPQIVADVASSGDVHTKGCATGC